VSNNRLSAPLSVRSLLPSSFNPASSILFRKKMHAYRVCTRKEKLGFDLISDALPFSGLWYAEPDAISDAIGYVKTAGGPDRTADEVKLVYAKNTKWLLSGPHQLLKFAQ
jgi:hypothetical protein